MKVVTSYKKSHDIVYRAHNRLYISQVLTTYQPPLLVITMIEDAWEDVPRPRDRSAQDSVASLLKRIKKVRCSQVLSIFGPMAFFLRSAREACPRISQMVLHLLML